MTHHNLRSLLGRTVAAPQAYDKSILVREPRQSNRAHLDIEAGKLPFVGVDVWNGYEISALCDSGLPTAFIAKVTYSCESRYLVESKSMKLYWNSFNRERQGRHPDEVRRRLIEIASADLGELLETEVRVELRDASNEPSRRDWPFRHDPGRLLENQSSVEEIVFDTFMETPELLDVGAQTFDRPQTLSASSCLLKSNCKITSQADWGDVFVEMTGRKLPSAQGLLKYIVSFRDECHFHEEIVECLYQRLWTRFQPDTLVVTALYTRRGGWDICPHRASHPSLLAAAFTEGGQGYRKTPRQ